MLLWAHWLLQCEHLSVLSIPNIALVIIIREFTHK